MGLKSANVTRLPASGVVAEATYILIAGDTLPKHGQFASITALLGLDSGLLSYDLGSVGGNGGGWRHRGVRFVFGGTGADNSQIKFKIYAAFATGSGQRILRLLGEVTATLSATVGAAGLLFDADTIRVADTIAWIESAWYTAERAANGVAAASAYSPGSDLEAVLDIADVLGASEVIIDSDLQANATGAVVLAEGWT